MALAMVHPWKHKSGIFYLRRRVPDELKAVLGIAEIRRSLDTRDPVEAKRRLSQALVELDAQWANLKRGPQSLSEREAHAFALAYEDQHFAEHRDNPSQQTSWDVALSSTLWTPEPLVRLDLAKSISELLIENPDLAPLRRREMRDWCLHEAAHCLKRHGLLVDEIGYKNLSRAIAAAMQRASLRLSRLAEGESDGAMPLPTVRVHSMPDSRLTASTIPAVKAIRFATLIEEWAAERRPTAKTLYTFSSSLRQFEHFVGHDDASKIIPEDIVRWKLALIETRLNTKTIRDSKLAPVKAIFAIAVRNLRVPLNPVQGILVSHKDDGEIGDKDFTDDEARIILRAANAASEPLFRWTPWVCAYTGARISEVCQLRVQDIGVEDDIDFIHFTKGAGSLKNRPSERIIPMHPALIKSGFLEYVKSIGAGPIFPHVKPDRFGSRGGSAEKKINPWIHSLFDGGIRKQPSHAWRHRMITLTREFDLRSDVSRALTGHSQESTHGKYGKINLRAMYKQIIKLPELDL